MNITLLRKVQQHISDEPKRFVMSTWRRHGSPGTLVLNGDYGLPQVIAPACGTVACISGWADVLSNNGINPLKLNEAQQSRLFYVGGWPKRFRDKFRRSRSPKNRVALANARIDYFIKTRGTR